MYGVLGYLVLFSNVNSHPKAMLEWRILALNFKNNSLTHVTHIKPDRIPVEEIMAV